MKNGSKWWISSAPAETCINRRELQESRVPTLKAQRWKTGVNDGRHQREIFCWTIYMRNFYRFYWSFKGTLITFFVFCVYIKILHGDLLYLFFCFHELNWMMAVWFSLTVKSDINFVTACNDIKLSINALNIILHTYTSQITCFSFGFQRNVELLSILPASYQL